MREILGAPDNLAKSGFKSNFMITYFPEILQIGYACFTYRRAAAHDPASYEYLLISKDPLLGELTDSYISQDSVHRFTTMIDGEPVAPGAPIVAGSRAYRFQLLDVATINLCRYAYNIVVAVTGVGSQYATICQLIMGAVAPIPVNPLQILDIYGIYQTMYTNELRLVIWSISLMNIVLYHMYKEPRELYIDDNAKKHK